MKHKNALKLAAALIATSILATPIATAYAAPGGHGAQSEWAMFDGGSPKGKFEGKHSEHHKGEKSHRENRERAVPLTPGEARILMDAMLLKTGTVNLTTGDALMAEEPGKIDVLLVNAEGNVVKVVKFDAKSGHMERSQRRELRKLMARPDPSDRYNRSYNTDQITLLANAMVIRFGNGDLKLGDITETPRGTYNATVTNQAGDIVREMELSRVTGRPIS